MDIEEFNDLIDAAKIWLFIGLAAVTGFAAGVAACAWVAGVF